MGFFKWIIEGSGVGKDERDNNELSNAYNGEENTKNFDKKNRKKDKKKNQTNESPYINETNLGNFNQSNNNANSSLNSANIANKYDTPMIDYGVGGNVGGFGSKNVNFVSPTDFHDVVNVIENMRNGDSIMLNLNYMDKNQQRYLDVVTGATHALKGNIERVDNNIYFITPEGYNIKIQDTSRNPMNNMNH